jgi:hypothetical protein
LAIASLGKIGWRQSAEPCKPTSSSAMRSVRLSAIRLGGRKHAFYPLEGGAGKQWERRLPNAI